MVAGGDIILAAHVNDLQAVQPVSYTKASSTPRNTTTTLAADPELQGIDLDVGVYEIELILFFTLTTTATQKIKTRWGFTGTWDNNVRACIGPGVNQTGAPSSVTDVQLAAYQASGQDATYDQAAGGTYGIARETGTLTVTVAGDLSLNWAQSVSSGNNTTVHAGTQFRVRRVSP